VELLVVRHAIAEEREAFAVTGKPDAERPLTDEGRRKFVKVARGLAALVESVDVLATSPLARATETGEILARELELGRAARLVELAPDAEPRALMPWLRKNASRSCVAVVGHEPHLSLLVEYLLTGAPGRGFVTLKKGGACLLSLGRRPVAGRAELAFLLTPGQLRRLA
jgi:phosphohistidine phosphatase